MSRVNEIQQQIQQLQKQLIKVNQEIHVKKELNQSKMILNANRGMVLHTNLEQQRFYVCPNVIHTLGLGPTGTGKSQMLVFPTMEVISRPSFPSVEQLQKNGADEKTIKQATYLQESMIVNDVKGELLANTYELLKNRGYNIKVINLEEPYHSHAWNPFETIKKHYLDDLNKNLKNPDLSNTTNLSNAFAHILNDDPNAKDKFWQDTAKNLTSGATLAMVEDLLFEDNEICFPTLNEKEIQRKARDSFTPHVMVNTISTLASTPYDDKTKMLDYYFTSRPLGNLPKQKASAMTSAGENTKGSILSTALTNLDLFTDESIARLTSMNEIDFEDLINEPTAIFIVCPDDNPTRWALASIFVEQSYFTLSKLIKKIHKGKSPRRINYLLDEFAQMPSIPDLDKKTSMSRSRNIRFFLFVQDMNQFNVKYGDYAPIIKNNCQNMVYIKTNDMPAVEETFKKLGTRTVVRKSVSAQLGETSYQVSESLEEEPLLHMNELMELPFEKGVVLRLGRKPIFSDFYSAFRYFTYRDDNGEIHVGIRETDVEGLIPRGKHADIDLNERVYYCNPTAFEKGEFIAGKYVFESIRVTKEYENKRKGIQQEDEFEQLDKQVQNSYQSVAISSEPTVTIESIKEQLRELGVTDTYLSNFDYGDESDWTLAKLERVQRDLNDSTKTLAWWQDYCLNLSPDDDSDFC